MEQKKESDVPVNLNACKGSSATSTGFNKVANRDVKNKHNYLNCCVNKTAWHGQLDSINYRHSG